MSVDRAQIAERIDQLDTPDEASQKEVRAFLVDHARDHLDVLTANLSVTSGRTRRGLVRVLVELDDRRALLPLMRFIHDAADDYEEDDARAIAMRHLTSMADDEDRERLFDFFVDMRDDHDPYVRGYAVAGLGELGDPGARPFVRDALDDDDEFVRQQAEEAVEALRGSDESVRGDAPTRAELEQKIRTASGVRLRYLTEELVRHAEGFEIARDLLFDDEQYHMLAVRALRRIDDARARDAAARFLEERRPDSERAAALRLLADYVEGDASEVERALVRDALAEDDIFVRLAGLEAAARSGDRALVLEVIDRAEDDGLDGIETVAEGLSNARLAPDREVAERIFDLLRKVRLEMRHSDGATWMMSTAYLLRALKRAVTQGWSRRPEAIDTALGAMRDRPKSRPVAVTGLELLLALVPDDGLPRHRRWHADDVKLLVRAANEHGDDLMPRVLDIIARTASPQNHDLGRWFERAMGRLQSRRGRTRLARAISEVVPNNAEELLESLAKTDNPDTKKAAEAALRRVRNHRGIIDVDFRRASSANQESPD